MEGRAAALAKALDEFKPGDPAEAGRRISAMAKMLRDIAEALDEANEAWDEYIGATIEGAGSVKRGLEITRDVSFGIAIGIGAVVAAPVVAAALGTGTLATGGFVIGGGALAGATMRGGGTLAGEALFNDSVDWRNVGGETGQGFVHGGLDAAVGLLAPGTSAMVSKAGSGASARVLGTETAEQLTTRLGQSATGRFLLRSGTHVPTGSILGAGHAGLSTAITGDIEDVPQAMKQGMKWGAAFGLLGAAAEPLFRGLAPYRTRGTGHHGTSTTGARAINETGPELRGSNTDDFGRGFYLADDPNVARAAAGRFDRVPTGDIAVVDVPLPRRGTLLDLGEGQTGRDWNTFMSEPYMPGSSSRASVFEDLRIRMGNNEFAPPDTVRLDLYNQFLKEYGIATPDMVRGPLPGYGEGATQVVVTSQEMLQLMHYALKAGNYQMAVYAVQAASALQKLGL